MRALQKDDRVRLTENTHASTDRGVGRLLAAGYEFAVVSATPDAVLVRDSLGNRYPLPLSVVEPVDAPDGDHPGDHPDGGPVGARAKRPRRKGMVTVRGAA